MEIVLFFEKLTTCNIAEKQTKEKGKRSMRYRLIVFTVLVLAGCTANQPSLPEYNPRNQVIDNQYHISTWPALHKSMTRTTVGVWLFKLPVSWFSTFGGPVEIFWRDNDTPKHIPHRPLHKTRYLVDDIRQGDQVWIPIIIPEFYWDEGLTHLRVEFSHIGNDMWWENGVFTRQGHGQTKDVWPVKLE